MYWRGPSKAEPRPWNDIESNQFGTDELLKHTERIRADPASAGLNNGSMSSVGYEQYDHGWPA